MIFLLENKALLFLHPGTISFLIGVFFYFPQIDDARRTNAHTIAVT